MTQPTCILLLFFIFCVPAFALEPEARGESGAKPAAEKVRVLSYNIHMWQIGVDELAAVIRKSEADIIGLNEAWDEKRNEAIAKELAYNSVFGGCSPTGKASAKAQLLEGLRSLLEKNSDLRMVIRFEMHKFTEHKLLIACTFGVIHEAADFEDVVHRHVKAFLFNPRDFPMGFSNGLGGEGSLRIRKFNELFFCGLELAIFLFPHRVVGPV
ncbi:MAG: hypothetical protein ACJAVK_000490 [Akkermansiaceae bacterium]|jgi:hypothetical protein